MYCCLLACLLAYFLACSLACLPACLLHPVSSCLCLRLSTCPWPFPGILSREFSTGLLSQEGRLRARVLQQLHHLAKGRWPPKLLPHNAGESFKSVVYSNSLLLGDSHGVLCSKPHNVPWHCSAAAADYMLCFQPSARFLLLTQQHSCQLP